MSASNFQNTARLLTDAELDLISGAKPGGGDHSGMGPGTGPEIGGGGGPVIGRVIDRGINWVHDHFPWLL